MCALTGPLISGDVVKAVFGEEVIKKISKNCRNYNAWGGVDPINGATGLKCYMLKAAGYVSDAQEAFYGFDT